MPVGTDEGMFYHIGQQISQGALPYRDVWEHKPPVAFYIFAAVLKVSNTNAALILLAVVWTLCTAGLMYGLARELFDEKSAQYATLLYAIAANIHRFAQGGNHTEVYMLPFIILLYLFVLRFYRTQNHAQLFWAGLFLGIGFQAKPVAIFSGLAACVFLVYGWWQNKQNFIALVNQLAVYTIGFVVPNIILFGYFAAVGILKDFIDLNYGYNAMYVTRNNTSAMRLQWFKETVADNMVSIPHLWLLFVPAFLAIRRQVQQPGWVLIYLAFFFDLAGVCLGGKFHGHYWLQLMPVAALLAVVGYSQLRQDWLRKIIWFLLIISLLFHTFSTGKQIYKKYVLHTPDTFKQAGYYIRERTLPTERIYVNGVNPQVYFHADRPIVWNVETDNILRRLSDVKLKEYEALFKARKPLYIVITERPLFFAWQEAYIQKYYLLETTIQTCEIYRRK